MSPHAAEQLKQRGNTHFNEGEYEAAVTLYSQAIQQNSASYLLYTNRANARLKLGLWQEVIDDCLRSIDLEKINMKGFYFLGKAHCSLCQQIWPLPEQRAHQKTSTGIMRTLCLSRTDRLLGPDKSGTDLCIQSGHSLCGRIASFIT